MIGTSEGVAGLPRGDKGRSLEFGSPRNHVFVPSYFEYFFDCGLEICESRMLSLALPNGSRDFRKVCCIPVVLTGNVNNLEVEFHSSIVFED